MTGDSASFAAAKARHAARYPEPAGRRLTPADEALVAGFRAYLEALPALPRLQ